MVSEADRRLIRSDSGQSTLERAKFMKRGLEPIGNVNMGDILRLVKLGLIDGDGITPAGRKALEE